MSRTARSTAADDDAGRPTVDGAAVDGATGRSASLSTADPLLPGCDMDADVSAMRDPLVRWIPAIITFAHAVGYAAGVDVAAPPDDVRPAPVEGRSGNETKGKSDARRGLAVEVDDCDGTGGASGR